MRESNIHAANVTTKQHKKVHLASHVLAIHVGVRFPCDKCNYKATQKTHLWEHIKTRHTLEKQQRELHGLLVI